MDKQYIYGDQNGASYRTDGSDEKSQERTHWDPRVEVGGFAHSVQVGVVPASKKSTDETGIWDSDDGQYLHLNRDGLNRLIRALQEAGRTMFGTDAW